MSCLRRSIRNEVSFFFICIIVIREEILLFTSDYNFSFIVFLLFNHERVFRARISGEVRHNNY